MFGLKKRRAKDETTKAKLVKDYLALGTMMNMWGINRQGYGETTRDEHICSSLKRYFSKVSDGNMQSETDISETGRAVKTLQEMWNIYCKFYDNDVLCRKMLIAKMEQYYVDFNNSQSEAENSYLETTLRQKDSTKWWELDLWLSENIK
jgi:hypothetical protein